jgi:hypothetical protein
MPASPVSTINSAGVAEWTNPATPPAFWIVELCFDDGAPALYADQTSSTIGTNVTFDAFDADFPGGFRLKLYGIDEDGNLVLSPTLSTNTTKFI